MLEGVTMEPRSYRFCEPPMEGSFRECNARTFRSRAIISGFERVVRGPERIPRSRDWHQGDNGALREQEGLDLKATRPRRLVVHGRADQQPKSMGARSCKV